MKQKKPIRDLVDAVAPCWAGEALVARRYLGNGHRTPERDVAWIGFQIFKEFSGGGVYGGPGATVASILEAATRRACAIGLATPPIEIEQILDDLNFAVDELRHMTQFIGLYALAGGDPQRSIESLGQFDHARRLAALRQQARTTDEGRAAVNLSEGGGLGLQFGMQEHYARHAPTSAVDREVVRLSGAILADETNHLRSRFRSVAALGDVALAWPELTRHLVAISTQKLRERNEQFSSPLDDAEIAQIVADRSLGRDYVRQHLGFLIADL